MSKLKFDCKTSEARLPIFITNTIRLQPQPTSSSRGGRLTMENRHRLFSGLGGFWFLGFVSCKLKSGALNKLGNTDVFLSNRSDKVFLARDYRMLGQYTGTKQGDYDGRGQQCCRCNFVHFYSGAQPPCSQLVWGLAPMLTASSGCD